MELSFFEVVLIAVIAFVVLGPEEMILRSRQLGRFVGRARTEVNNWKILAEEQLVRTRSSNPQERQKVQAGAKSESPTDS